MLTNFSAQSHKRTQTRTHSLAHTYRHIKLTFINGETGNVYRSVPVFFSLYNCNKKIKRSLDLQKDSVTKKSNPQILERNLGNVRITTTRMKMRGTTCEGHHEYLSIHPFIHSLTHTHTHITLSYG